MNPNLELDLQGVLSVCLHCGQRNRLRYDRVGQGFRCGKCRAALSLPGEPLDVPNAEVFEALWQKSPLPVLVDFWAPWCGPCKMVAPELAKVAAESVGQWLTIKVNTEHVPELAQRFRISGIPTLVLGRQGTELARQSGALPAVRIHQFVEQNVFARSR